MSDSLDRAERAALRAPPPVLSGPRVDVLRHAPRKTAALLHIGACPGASNRAIAAGIGICDEGQVSKLLAHIQDLGLVINRTHDRGRPNAWHLTGAGRRLVRALGGAGA